MKVAVFCSANQNIRAEYFQRTAELGKWLAENGHTVVFGGCSLGLMECIARAAHEAGGQTIGVVPTIIEERGAVSDCVDIHIACADLSDRKQLMLLHSDVSIALPGGLGTLDEIFSVVAAATIGYHHQRVILYNMEGFWDNLIAMLNAMQQQGFIRNNWSNHILVANSLQDVAKCLGE